MIYVTVGTMFMDFPRLIRAMDDIAQSSDEEIIIQTGMGATLPRYATHFDFKPRDEVQSIQARARVIVCHAGIGCIHDALAACRPLIVVPRLKRWGEHMNDHQLDLARAVETRGWGRMVMDIAEMASLCEDPPPAPLHYHPASVALVNAIRNDISSLTGVPA